MITEKDGKENEFLKLIILSGKKTDENIMFNSNYHNLLELESTPLALTDLIFSIMFEIEENKILKLNEMDQKHVIIYLKNWLGKLYFKKEATKIKNLIEIILKMIGILFSDKVFDSNKTFFEEILQSLFNLMRVNKEITIEKINNLVEKIFTDLKNEMLVINNIYTYEKIRCYLIMTESLAFFHSSNIKHNSEMLEFFGLLNLILEKFILISPTSEKNKVFLFNQLSGTFCKISVKLLEVFKKEGILKYLSIANNKNDKDNSKLNDPFFNCEIFLILIERLLKMNNNFQTNQNNLISDVLFYVNLENMSDIKYGINSAKSNLIELVTILSENLTNSILFENFEILKTFCKNLCSELIKGLSKFFQTYNKNEFIEKSENEEGERLVIKHIVRILEYFIICAQNSAGVNIFTENKIEIMRYIIMPNLNLTKLEEELFKNDPNEFSKNLIDMTSKQETKSPKHKAIKLIDIMSEYIDTFLKFVTEFYTDLITFVISKNNPNSTINFTILKENQCQIFHEYIQSLPDENLIDQSLLVLSSISYLIYEKQKLRIFFEDKIESYNHILIQIRNEMIKAKLCNFYSYTLDDMFHDDNNILSKAFDDSFHFLFNCLISENKSQTLNLIAIESLHSLLFEDKMRPLVSQFVKIYINNILNLIHNQKFKVVTQNILYHNFLKYLLNKFFNEIENDLIFVFAYFWNDIKLELENVIKNETNNSFNILQEKKFKLLEQIHNLKSLVETCITKCFNMETKSKIFEEILTIFNFLDKFINYDYEEDLLEILILIINDIKLIPDNYKDKLNILIEKMTMNYNYKFERYHVNFIFTFLKNLRKEDYLFYKNSIFSLINVRLLYVEKSTSVMKIFNNHSIFTDLLMTFIIFFWNDLEIDEGKEFDKSDYFSILNLITRRLGMHPISDDVLPRKLCLCFYLIVIKLNNICKLEELKKFKNLEILLVKSFTLTSDIKSLEENSISSIFASNITLFLFKEYYSQIQNFNKELNDNSMLNYIKNFINFNVDQLLYLRSSTSENKEKNKFKEEMKDEIKNKKGNFLKKLLNDYENKVTNKIRIPKYEINEDSEDSFINESDSFADEENEEEDLIKDILDENDSGDDDKDDEFLKVKSYKRELHNFLQQFAPDNLNSYLNSINEFQLFNDTLNFIQNQNNEIYLYIMNSFTKTKLNLISIIRKFKKIIPNSDNKNTKFRKIVKIKRK